MLTKKENLKNDTKGNKNAKTPSPLEDHNGCCQPSTRTVTQMSPNTHNTHPNVHEYDLHSTTSKKGAYKTRITIKYDVGFHNQLFIRGKGANLSWDKGQPLKNIKHDEWLWETDANFTSCEFKILINDRVYENGANHHLNAGSTLLYTPHFY